MTWLTDTGIVTQSGSFPEQPMKNICPPLPVKQSQGTNVGPANLECLQPNHESQFVWRFKRTTTWYGGETILPEGTPILISLTILDSHFEHQDG
jgi:hypothetical protein